MSNLLEVNNLLLSFPAQNFVAVNQISFAISEGEVLALVGESGSGKTLTALSILGLEPANSFISGNINFAGQALLDADAWIPAKTRKYPRQIRSKEIAFIPQDPLSALNPMYTIGNQLQEAIKVYNKKITQHELESRCFQALVDVSIADPEQCLLSYPHQISGGMRQRVMIAMALINDPKLLIADEPTTALDVTVQASILKLLKSLKKTTLFITHDLAVVAEIADRVIVMKNGSVIESATVFEIFEEPKQPYTKLLLESVLR